MLIEPPTNRSGNPESTDVSTQSAAPARRRHSDASASMALFGRLAELEHGPERDSIRDELTTAWLPLAYHIAGRFRDRGESIEDLRQVAALGLFKAIDRFDPERGAFVSYAVPTITGEVKRHFRDRMWALRVPRRVQELRNKVRIARGELAQIPGSPEPSVASLAAHTGLTEKEVSAGMEALECFNTLSLDVELSAGDDGYSLADTLSAVDTSYDTVIAWESVKDGLRRLPERERSILYMRFFEDMTQSRIADRLGISQMHVSRLISHSCARVRNEVMEQPSARPSHRART
ncbi:MULTISPECIES: SigB/SigF/SigG family RNA polymerase sigma factor [unclassified Streptomyces]|uniref:SigB/SigF/SigG family RNA polymerase sigma factor n=1 Tax=unclassified Streptomyces TaxID=2593676 RepID=UPI0004C5394A|nr:MULTISPECIES: SigB/SigF/SigG family RNA polymerase sigma factor [unclassified Streptomyces]KOV71350.1 RNA polymerase sigma factor [Streptomyces sp. NRRL WC-3723]